MSDAGPTVFNGCYELHRRLGRGGMADVSLARDQLLDRPVAVKALFPEFATDPSFVERFRREATAAANLNHPNIVGVYDWGEAEGTYFMVMEFVDGRSLSEILRSEEHTSELQSLMRSSYAVFCLKKKKKKRKIYITYVRSLLHVTPKNTSD